MGGHRLCPGFDITGNTNWLNLAQTALGVVWGRARISNDAALYGLNADSGTSGDDGTNISAAVNYGFIVGAHWLASIAYDQIEHGFLA